MKYMIVSFLALLSLSTTCPYMNSEEGVHFERQDYHYPTSYEERMYFIEPEKKLCAGFFCLGMTRVKVEKTGETYEGNVRTVSVGNEMYGFYPALILEDRKGNTLLRFNFKNAEVGTKEIEESDRVASIEIFSKAFFLKEGINVGSQIKKCKEVPGSGVYRIWEDYQAGIILRKYPHLTIHTDKDLWSERGGKPVMDEETFAGLANLYKNKIPLDYIPDFFKITKFTLHLINKN